MDNKEYIKHLKMSSTSFSYDLLQNSVHMLMHQQNLSNDIASVI